MDKEVTITVAEFNKLIDLHLKSIGTVSVIGEITEKTITRNSGLIVTLKDIDGENKTAILKLTGFAPHVKGVNSVEVGMKVVATGIPQLYSPFGAFSLQISSIQPFGKGSIKQAFEKLKALLEQEGLFDSKRKRSLPAVVTKIILITADNSAAKIDFLKILKETKTQLDIEFFPVNVQGKKAVDEIVRAFKRANKRTEIDCIVLTRGGGSLEDLLAFNSEEVARAIFSSKYPVISAVGHERDTSISDMVADIVASTPSQAAYYLANHNQAFLENYIENLDSFYNKITSDITFLESRLNLQLIYTKINEKLNLFKQKATTFSSILTAYNPKEAFKRGFALVRKNSKIIKSKKELKLNDKLKITLQDGDISSLVIEL